MARPKKEFNQRTFEGLCKIQATLEEIAQVMGVSEDTIERRCAELYGLSFADTYKKHSAEGKTSIRRAQFKMAQNNPTMAIWLGKQYLGQRDKSEIEYRDLDAAIERELANIIPAGKTQAVREAEGSERIN